MSPDLQTLVELQDFDVRIARLEADAARLPKQLEAIQAALAEAKKLVDVLRSRSDTTKKELRA